MRFAALAACLIGTVVFAVLVPFNSVFVAPFALCAVLSAIGIWDLLQTRHSIRRNYPILAHIRFILEKVRPEIRQYFLESETDGTPFNRSKRAIAYQRAKGALDKRIRHPAGHLRLQLRVDQPFDRSVSRRSPRLSRHGQWR